MLMILGRQSDYDAMHGNAEAGPNWSEEELRAMFTFMGAVGRELTETGELVDARGLSEPRQAWQVRAGGNGEPVVTDGPYGEAKEVLAGYWMVDCESVERVTEIAARIHQCPLPEGAPNYPVVVHPVPEPAGTEM